MSASDGLIGCGTRERSLVLSVLLPPMAAGAPDQGHIGKTYRIPKLSSFFSQRPGFMVRASRACVRIRTCIFGTGQGWRGRNISGLRSPANDWRFDYIRCSDPEFIYENKRKNNRNFCKLP